MKINFTKQHMDRLVQLASNALFNRTVVNTKLGQVLNIYELLHTTSINQLNEIKASLSKKIEKVEESDEWVQPDNDRLEYFKNMKELVNLIVGWKRYSLELEEMRREKESLIQEIKEIEESEKTPAEKKTEKEARLKELEEEFK